MGGSRCLMDCHRPGSSPSSRRRSSGAAIDRAGFARQHLGQDRSLVCKCCSRVTAAARMLTATLAMAGYALANGDSEMMLIALHGITSRKSAEVSRAEVVASQE